MLNGWVHNLIEEQLPVTLHDLNLTNFPIVYASDAYLQMTGYQLEEIIGKGSDFVYGPLTDTNVSSLAFELAKEKAKHELLLQTYKKDGTPFWDLMLCKPMLAHDERCLSYIIIHQEVHETNANQLPQQSLVRLLDVRDPGDRFAFMGVANAEGKLTYVNAKTCEISQYSFDDFMGQSLFWKIIDDEDANGFNGIWSRLRKGQFWRGDLRFLKKDGIPSWVDVTIVPALAANNQPYQYFIVGHDANERKHVEERLRKSEGRYFSLLMSMPSGCSHQEVIYGDYGDCHDFYYQEVNNAFLEIFGITREAIIGRRYTEVCGLFDFPSHWSATCCGIASTGGTFKFDDFYCARTEKWLTVSVYSVEHGQFALIVEDVTERKLNEQELERARTLAEEASLAKTQFLANISHEMRTPLNGIMGLTELTLLTELGWEQRENLAIIKTCADTLSKVINDVLDLSKIEAGKLELESVNFHLEDLINRTLASHYLAAHEKKLVLNAQVLPNTPNHVNGDPSKIQQILHNLVSNAIKFTESGAIHLSVQRIHELQSEVCLLFAIRDTGIGIAKKDQDRLFQSFSQIDASHTRKYGGSGLGLSISKRLAERMGGNLWVASQEGEGSTFSFTVKLAAADTSSKSARISPPNDRLRGVRVLLAEDDPVSRQIVSKVLNDRHIEIILAKNGEEVLRLLDRNRVDLVLMDIQMPVMDGLESTRRIRNHTDPAVRRLPVVAVTAHALKDDEATYVKEGINAFVSKPISFQKLIDTIEGLLPGIKGEGR
ncbi:ATP-binding protein [Paenibacillus sp. TRM 82003]|nr:ATP-binding protein [Paenibacillus sp. TRM 82003]